MTGAEFERVDIDLLADYVGGALDGTPDEDRVAALVATDDAWRAAYEALEPGVIAVGAMLREFEPEPMPDELAARLDAMFRSSATEHGTASAEPAANGRAEVVPAKVVDLESVRRRRRRWVAPIAVAAAAVAFAGVGIGSLLGTESMRDAQSAAGSAANSQTEIMSDSAEAGAVTTRSGTDYTSGTLAGAADTPIRSFGAKDSPVPAEEPVDVFGLDRLNSPDALAACIAAISRENGGLFSVELVDFARFNGSPAVIVKFSAANGTWVWAVGPECGASGAGADLKEQVPVR